MDFGFPRTRGDALRICPVEAYPNLTPYKRRLQAGHADGWGLGGPHTDDGDQTPQIPNSGSYPLEWTSKGPGSNLEGGTTRGGRSVCLTLRRRDEQR